MSTQRRETRRASILVLGLALVLCVFAYWPALSGGFIFDDFPLLVNQTCWRGVDRIPSILGVSGEPQACGYRPIRYVSHAIDYSIAGMSATAFHLSNLLHHLVAFLAVFALFRRLTGSLEAAVGAAIWALHPVNSDVVAYISGRRDLLTGLFFVLALLPLIPRPGKQLNLRGLAISIVFFWLAFRSKEMAVTLPVVAGWFVVTQHHTAIRPILRRSWRYAPFAVLAGWFFLDRAILRPHTHIEGWWGDSITSNFATVLALYPRYFELVLWPARLIGDYYRNTIPIAESFSDPRSLLGGSLLIVLVGGIVVSMCRKQPLVAFGLGWFLITMLPVSHIIPHHELFAEHYLYIPLMGLVIAALPLIRWAVARKRRTSQLLSWTAVASILLVFAGRTHVRGYDYRDEITFNLAAFQHTPNNLRVLYTLGINYAESDECELAFLFLNGAINLVEPGSILSHQSLAAHIQCNERLENPSSRQLLDRFVSEFPDHPFGLVRLGRLAFEEGDDNLAIELLERAQADGARVAPWVLDTLASAYNRSGRHQDALVLLSSPDSVRTLGSCEQKSLALIGLGGDNLQRAFVTIESCLESFPRSFVLLELHAQFLIELGRPDLARLDIERLQELGAPESTLSSLRALLP